MAATRLAAAAAAILAIALSPAGAAAAQYDIDLSATLGAYGTLDQTQVGPPADDGSNNFCAPTATMNSFTFLSNAYPSVYGNALLGGTADWLSAAQLLAGPGFMNTNRNTGTTEANWINGKVNYINTYAPGTTYFEGMDHVATGGQPWVQPAYPTAAFLLRMLQQGQDVEIGLTGTSEIGHVMTLSSIHWTDANDNLLLDPGESLTIDGYDPAGDGTNAAPFNYALSLDANNALVFNGGPYNGYVLDAALAESVPEPGTVTLLVMGAGMLGVFRARRKAR
jgi:hypothetical protein